MEIFKRETSIDFLSKRRAAYVVSIAFIVFSLGSFLFRGMELGIDFTGGTLIEVAYPEAVELQPVRGALADAGFGEAQVQHFGGAREVLVRLAPREGSNSAEISSQVLAVLEAQEGGNLELLRVEFVGPQVGDELAEDGGLAVLFALIGVLLYVAFRFEKRFALGAVAALAHDVIITVGIFSLFRLEFDLTVLAAVLAVIGYSLNDTIVIFDRIRDNFRIMRRSDTMEVMNRSLNQTLSRTIITGLTTLLVLLSLLIWGGDTIFGFSLALVIGILVGTYSSVYIASALALALGVSRQDMVPGKEERSPQAEQAP
jgi:preprotein translocase subunit SecF